MMLDYVHVNVNDAQTRTQYAMKEIHFANYASDCFWSGHTYFEWFWCEREPLLFNQKNGKLIAANRFLWAIFHHVTNIQNQVVPLSIALIIDLRLTVLNTEQSQSKESCRKG